MTIVGPGSEWFWAAAQFLLVAVSLAGIYRQLKAQGSANAFQRLSTLHDRWMSERLVRARLKLVISLRQGHVPRAGVFRPLAEFFEDIALLEEGGHVSSKEVWLDWNRTVELWWTVLEPAIQRERSLYPGDFSGFERLRDRMVELDRRAGRPQDFGPDVVRRVLDDMSVSLAEQLRLDLETRDGLMPTIPPEADT